MRELKPYQVRVLDELEALEEKYRKLSEFLASPCCAKVAPEERALLCRQQAAMELYLAVLRERTHLWEGKK